MNRIAAIGVTVLAGVLLAGCVQLPHLPTHHNTAAAAPHDDVTTPPADDLGRSLNNPAPAGSALNLTTNGGAFSLSFGSVVYNANADIASINQFNPAPAAGLQYLVATVTVTNTGTGNIDAGLVTYSGISFVVNGSSYQKAPFAVISQDLGSVHAVAPGTSASGSLAFEVPVGTVKGTWVVTAGNESLFVTA